MILPLPTLAAVMAIGVTQIISWGTSFYVLGVLGDPIARDTGWSTTTVFGGFTLAVVASSAISTAAGSAIDRLGSQRVMTVGFVALAAALWLLAQAQTTWHYYAAWGFIGIAMRLTLYDAAFAAAVQVDVANGQRAIAYLTLIGGFASTVGWPIGHALSDAYGWRTTLEIFALINLVIAAPVAWFACAYRAAQPDAPSESVSTAPAGTSAAASQSKGVLHGRRRVIAMVLFAAVMASNAINFGIASVHMPAMIAATGIATGLAVSIAALKGVAQVGARLFDILFGARVPPMQLARFAVACLFAAYPVLLLLPGSAQVALAFVITFGIANGLATIVRGTVPLALFGHAGYGRILGILATPFLLFNAISPLAFAMISDTYGITAATWVLAAISLAGIVMMEVLAGWYRRLS
ncbi:MAG: MFS transporter [Pseudomonadota bacterium]